MQKHTPNFDITVVPELRRQGHDSRELLGKVVLKKSEQSRLHEAFDSFHDRYIADTPKKNGRLYDNLAYVAAIVKHGHRQGLLVLRESGEAVIHSGLATKGHTRISTNLDGEVARTYVPSAVSAGEALPETARYMAYVLRNDGSIEEMEPVSAFWTTDNPKTANRPVELQLTFKHGQEFEDLVISGEVPSHGWLSGLDEVDLEGLQEFSNGPNLVSDPSRPATM